MSDRPTVSLDQYRSGGRIEFTHPDSGVVVRVERPELNGRALWASVELRIGDNPETVPLAWQSTNLMSPGSIKNLWRDLRDPYPKVPWSEILTQASYAVVSEHLRGGPAVRLADLDPSSGVRWVLEPFVEEGGATILAAGGELGKSYLCLAAAVSVATGETVIGDFAPNLKGPALYLDWETSADTHNYRLRTICAGAGIDPATVDVYYRGRETQPLKSIVHQVTAMCDELGVVFLVIDSVMLARGGDAFGPEETINLFGALSEIGRPALLADHKSREAISKGRRGAYGSVAGQNSARLLWEGREGPGTGLDGRKVVILENTKANNAPKHHPIALSLTWAKEPVHTFTVDQFTADNMELGREGDLPMWQILHDLLSESEPLEVADIVERLTRQGHVMQPNAVRVALSRNKGRFRNLRPKGSTGLWTTASDELQLPVTGDEGPGPEPPPADDDRAQPAGADQADADESEDWRSFFGVDDLASTEPAYDPHKFPPPY